MSLLHCYPTRWGEKGSVDDEQIPSFQCSQGACRCVFFFLCISLLYGEESYAYKHYYPCRPSTYRLRVHLRIPPCAELLGKCICLFLSPVEDTVRVYILR